MTLCSEQKCLAARLHSNESGYQRERILVADSGNHARPFVFLSHSWQPNHPTTHCSESVKLDSILGQSLVIILVTGTHWLGFSEIALVTLMCRLGSGG